MGTQILATLKEIGSKFECKTRDNGEKFWVFNGDSDFIREIHGTDILPDDWRFEKIDELVDKLQEYDFESVDRLKDKGLDYEIIDNLVDTYHGDLLTWVSSNLHRANFVEDFVDEMGRSKHFSLFKALQGGQYIEISMLMNNLLNTLEVE